MIRLPRGEVLLYSCEVCAYLGITPSTLRTLAQLGRVERAPREDWPGTRSPLYVRDSIVAYRRRRRRYTRKGQ